MSLLVRTSTASARRAPGPVAAQGAIVLGADYRGLGLVRSLGRRGVRVLVLEHGDDVLAGASRYAEQRLRLPDGSDSDRVAYLIDLAEEHGLSGWVLFPTADETAVLVARHEAELSRRFVLTTPPWDVLRWAYDKRLTNRLAQAVGVAHPRTWHPRTADEAASLELDFPAIVKPAIKEGFNRLTAAKAWRVDSPAELRDRFAEAVTLVSPEVLMVQELVPGGGESQFSYAALCRDGRPLATAVARRTRQYPADFGRASTYVETVEEPEVVEPSIRLIGEMGFTGLVEVEYKRDPRDGVYKLLDINPRVWGWHTLCGRAGVDFPYLAWLLARGEEVPELRAAAGARWVRLSTDLPTSLREIAQGRLSVRTYLRSLRGPVESAIFARDDPRPGLLELPLLARVLVRRLFRGDGV
jgi:predicted ATP-grasp superfamily ATP-dependent carboligase